MEKNLEFDNLALTIQATGCRPIEGGYIASAPRLTVRLPAAPVRYLYAGWQSWSLTTWLETARPLRPMRPYSAHPIHTDPAYSRETRPHGSWYGAVEFPDGGILFVGALGLESHVMLDGRSLTGWYETGKDPDWFIAAGDEEKIFARYAGLLGERFGRGRATQPERVWCSWYSLYTEINEDRLNKILGDLADLPFDVFQIDDGWQRGIGDWEPNRKFPSGMDGMAARIQATGRKAGLWLAPLLAVPSSGIYRQRRDWLLHDEKGRLVPAGVNWGEPLFALDTTHPAVLEWLDALMKKVRLWGYDYIKLDFLYAGALPGKHYADIPREAAYRNGLAVIREALGDAYFLTCGAPILPSLGLCDALRVGPDVAGFFASPRDDLLLADFSLPGVRNALRTTMHRLWLQPLLHPDPDVVYFRSILNNLTAEQASLLQDMAEICNFKATSDIPAWLTPSEMEALRRYLSDRPPVRQTGRTSFQIGERQVDFSSCAALPSHPGAFTRLQGELLGWLADFPVSMNIFDKLGRRAVRKSIAERPV